MTMYGHCGNIGHGSILVMWSRPFVTLQTPKKTPQKIGSYWPNGLREEHDNIQNFGAGPTTSLGHGFSENLVIFLQVVDINSCDE